MRARSSLEKRKNRLGLIRRLLLILFMSFCWNTGAYAFFCRTFPAPGAHFYVFANEPVMLDAIASAGELAYDLY